MQRRTVLIEGWDGYPEGTKKSEIVQDLTDAGRFKSRGGKLLDHEMVGDELWSVWNLPKDGVVILVDVFKKEGGEWLVKGMEERVGPSYYKCPKRFLDMAPVRNPQWRSKVTGEKSESPARGKRLSFKAIESRTMQHLIGRLEEAAGGYVAGNLNRSLENVYLAFFQEVAIAVNGLLKKSAMMGGDLTASVEPTGFDWPVLAVVRNGEMVYDLEMELDTGDEAGQFVVNKWEDVMQKDTKVLKVGLHQMAPDAAATFLVNYIRKDVATGLNKR